MIKKKSIKIEFGWITAYENKGKIFRVKYGKEKNNSTSRVLNNFRKNLLDFFNKKTKNIKGTFKIDGNKIQKKVWKELKKIKTGNTKSYREIAKKYKLSPRHVGKICAQNKLLLFIPCHRVIKSDGNLGGFSSVGGIKLKEKLLKFEQNF